MANNWLRNKNSHYQHYQKPRRLAKDFYEAKPENLLHPSDGYLEQRAQGESSEQYKERCKTSDILPLFAVLIDSYDGRVKQVESKVNRQWGDTLAERNALIDTNLDGKGKNWYSKRYDASKSLLLYNEVWGFVEGYGADGTPKVRVIEPANVWDWQYDQYGLKWVKVHNTVNVRSDYKQEETHEDRWHVYFRDGYEVWKEGGEEDKPIQVQERTPYGEDFAFWNGPEKDHKTLPIFRVRSSFKRYVSGLWAHKNKVLLNKESERDNILRVANTPKAVYAGALKRLKELLDDQKVGGNIWTLEADQHAKGHYFMAPDPSSAELSTEVIDKKVEHYFISGLRFYRNSAQGRQKTATEIGQDVAQGEGSFLQTHLEDLAQFERQLATRLEQAFSSEPSKWGGFSIENPDDLTPIDVHDEAKRLKENFFGRSTTLPVTEDRMAEVIKKIYAAHNITAPEEEIQQMAQEATRTKRRRDAASGVLGQEI